MSLGAAAAGGLGLYLRLPATSANLGPGFDTLALALALHLEIEARPAAAYSIEASGQSPEICSRLEGNLLLTVYRETVRAWGGQEAPALTLVVRNGIPLGMGCGSSAASRLAGVALATHFGALGWSREQVLAEACRLEGHPDNAAACWLGGFVASGWGAASAVHDRSGSRRQQAQGVATVAITPPAPWHGLLVLPKHPLATTASRAVLPASYSREDAVLNLQRVAVLTAAFATGRGELLAVATGDSLHQPYRGAVCPLLPLLLPLAGRKGILSVTLSGAGPAVLLLLASAGSHEDAGALVEAQLAGSVDLGVGQVKLLDCALAREGATVRELVQN